MTALRHVPRDDVLHLVSLVAERVVVLHMPSTEEGELGLSGRDIDCAVIGRDPLWPLRLPEGWRLCECLHYDLKGWYWVIENGGEVVALDTIDDPSGLGRDGFPTTLLAKPGLEASPAVRAAYLTMKRLRKGITAPREWERIGRLAREDPDGYADALRQVAGLKLRSVTHSGLTGISPGPDDFRHAGRVRLLRRFGTPGRALTALVLGARRYITRLVHPTGLLVVIAGPDGSGKSTLADALPDLCRGVFKREDRFHWRPGLLPRVGAFLGRPEGDATQPHARPPHGRLLSVMVLGYYWLDFVIGEWVKIWPLRIRAGLAVLERGWWDIAVDPRRYRLNVPDVVIRFLGGFLRRPDLVLVLEAEPRVLLQRKAEITEAELTRQMDVWRTVLPAGVPRLHMDASAPAPALGQQAREAILALMERRAISRLGAGWVALPTSSKTRWWIPRGPITSSKGGLHVYHPVTRRGRTGWEAARLLARIGGLRALPRGEAPPRAVREALASHLPPKASMAVGRANHPGRFVALIVPEHGAEVKFAKIATDPEGILALDREATLIESLGPRLPPPLSAPMILSREPGLLLLENAPWRPRRWPWRLEEEVAASLGAFFRSGARGDSHTRGSAHGDCAPWNLLRTQEGWVLVDWEDASPEQIPFYDLWHYVVQAHALLGRPSVGDLIEGVDGRGWVGQAVRAYADAAAVPVHDGGTFLGSYLRLSRARLTATTRRERGGLAARDRVLAALAAR